MPSSLETLFPLFNNSTDNYLYVNNSELVESTQLIFCDLDSNNESSSFRTVFAKVLHDTTCHELSKEWTVFLCAVYLSIFLFGFVGNFTVILVIACKRKMKTVTNLFILNLAVSDSLVIVFCIPSNLISNLFTPWILGGFMCKAVSYIQGVSVFSSVYTLVAISLERCQAIRKPLRLSLRHSKFQALCMIALIWISALILTLPWTFVFGIVHRPMFDSQNQSEHLPFCLETWGDRNYEKIYFLVANLFVCYCFPLILITIFNVIIWKSVLERHIPQISYSNSVYSTITEMHRITRLRVLKMVTCLTFAFFICWLPLYVVMTLVKFSSDPTEFGNWMGILVPFAQIMGSLNSCVNPVMYALLNKKFREVFITPPLSPLFRCCCYCQIASIGRRVKPAEEDQSLSIILRSNIGELFNPNVVNALSLTHLPMITVIKAAAYSSATALTAAPNLLKETSL